MSRGSRLLMDHVSLSFPTSQTSVYSLWINTDTQIYVCLNWKPLNNPRHLYTRSVWAYLFNFLSLREPLKPYLLASLYEDTWKYYAPVFFFNVDMCINVSLTMKHSSCYMSCNIGQYYLYYSDHRSECSESNYCPTVHLVWPFNFTVFMVSFHVMAFNIDSEHALTRRR